ncbi:MAG: TIR domain-containing protein [Anaerolineae bacterium]|nr:TIR domain-containing protein [Anaerolineae bacterium]
MSRLEDIKRLLSLHERRLQKLKEKQALQGSNTPAEDLIEMEDIEAEIETIEAEIKALTGAVKPALPAANHAAGTTEESWAEATITTLSAELAQLQQPHNPLTLSYQLPGKPPQTYRAPGNQVIVGRRKAIPVDVELTADPKVSRPHARLYYELGTWWVEDLDSTGGTWRVKDFDSANRTWQTKQRLTEATELAPGDQLQLGVTILTVAFTAPDPRPADLSLESQAPVDEIEPPPDLSEAARAAILVSIDRAATATTTLPSRLDRFLEIIGDYFPQADHRTILLRDEVKELIPAVTWPRGPVAQVSYTLARRAIRSQQVIHWVRDLSLDQSRYPSLEGTTAALCAPMLFNGRAIGVIYVDTDRADTLFDRKASNVSSELATVMARSLQPLAQATFPSFPEVFIAYAPADRRLVDRLRADLHRRRIKVRFDEHLRPGDDRQTALKSLIQATNAVIWVMSPSSVASAQVQAEVALAQQAGKHIFPVVVAPCQLPPAIEKLVWLDLTPERYDEGLERLADTIQEMPKADLVNPPPHQPAQASPAPGVPAGLPATAAHTRILVLAANPLDTDILRLGAEVRTIEERLRAADFGHRFQVISHWAVRYKDLSEYLLRHQPHIVHFCGHGNKGGKLVLEDETGFGQTVTAKALQLLFRVLKDNIRCVVLNACLSLSQAEAIANEIDCVVGMAAKIGDEAALGFAGGFYRALGYGRNVQLAFDLGCNEIDLAKLEGEAIPQLLVKPGVNAANITFI